MSYRSMPRIQELVRRSVFVLMASIVALTAVMTLPASAQPVQVADWRQSISGGVGKAVDRAPNGDYVVVGIESLSTIDPAYGMTMTLQRYSSNGQPRWAQPVRTSSTVAGLKATKVLVDADDNTFVFANEGDYNYRLCLPEDPTCQPGILGLFDGWWIVQKYSPTGTLLWQQRTLKVKQIPSHAAFDSSGDVYVLFANKGGTALIVRLASATGATVWSATTPYEAQAGAIALSSTGTVLVAGAGPYGLSISEFAPDSGARLIVTIYSEAAGSYAPGMAVGPQGEIAFTGKSAAGLFLGLESAARQPLFTISTTPGAEGRHVAVDAQGQLVVAGTVPSSSGTNWLLLRYDATGASVHAPVVIDRHASAVEEPRDLILGAQGVAYITGAAGPGTTLDPNATQAVTVRLVSNGTIDWVASESAGVRGVDAVLALDGSVGVLTAGNLSLVHYPVAASPIPTALTLSPTIVQGGKIAKGTVTVSAGTGVVVTLTSSNSTIVSVPSSVTVPSGVTTATFTMQTRKVRTNTSVTITATANGMSISSTLIVKR
ncbi:MAG: hypothetical protein U0223_16925 [Nitrospira sp.]